MTDATDPADQDAARRPNGTLPGSPEAAAALAAQYAAEDAARDARREARAALAALHVAAKRPSAEKP